MKLKYISALDNIFLDNITLEECIVLYEECGWSAVIHDGKVVGFEK